MKTAKIFFIVVFIILAAPLCAQEDEYPVRVLVNDIPGCKDLVEDLCSRGIVAEIYWARHDDDVELSEECEAIWLGCYVPLEIAVEAILTSWEHFPFLKYISITEADYACPDEVRYEVFIGGATSTALEEGLTPLDADDFRRAAAGFQTFDDLRRFLENRDTLDSPPLEK